MPFIFEKMKIDKRILSIVAFFMFISGIVAPFAPRIFGSDDIAVIFAIVAMSLALIFGVLGRSFLLGKVATIGALIVCVIGTINYVGFRLSANSTASQMQMQTSQAKSR
jgi:uncharacterized membrane protein